MHRSRVGFKGQPYDNFSFTFLGAYDFVGRDLLAGTVGGGNSGANPFIRLWLAKIEWQLDKNDVFNLTTGYFAPVVGRESNTPPTRVTSMEKAWSQNYLRRHIVGSGPGRSPGVNIGGIVYNQESKFKLQYDVGIHSPQFISFSGSSAGVTTTPMFAGKLTFDFGDPRSEGYSPSHKSNYFGKRNGATIAIGGTYQGETDLFTENTALGFEYGLHFGGINFDGEYHFLRRKGEGVILDPSLIEANGGVGFSRLSYNLPLKNGHIFVPYVLAVQFTGSESQLEKIQAEQLRAFSGTDNELSFGFEYNFNVDFKVTANLTLRDGEGAGNEEIGTNNNFFQQGGVGDFQRGNWLGLGMVIGL